MPYEETSAAILSVLSSFARPYIPDEQSSPTSKFANGIKGAQVGLPGAESAEKRALEQELSSLAVRIQALEAKAAGASSSLPITPSEPLPSVFAPETPATSNGVSPDAPRTRSASWINSLFTKSDGEQHTRQLTEEQFGVLREHIDQQAHEIKSQQSFIDGIKSQLTSQQTATQAALDTLGNSSNIEQLKREIEKNAQINATYQKVLREIGTIVTAVANGDLSKKVLIHVTEKDPEIARFKQTINKMVDQLQQFASQVTHLAKEVGTEGQLGGQAVVPGVDGIWAELTVNGMDFIPHSFPLANVLIWLQ